MLPTVIKSCPSAENDFEPLSEYQAQTPQTFFDGKAILYFHDEHIKAWCSEEQYQRLFFFTGAESAAKHPTPPESHALENEGGKHLREEANVHVFVASRYVIWYIKYKQCVALLIKPTASSFCSPRLAVPALRYLILPSRFTL